jgi:BNR/Asp-box repeat
MRKFFLTFLLALSAMASAYDPVADTRKIMAGTVTTTAVKRAYLDGKRDGTTVLKGARAAYQTVRAAEAPAIIPSAVSGLLAKKDADWKVVKVGAGGWLTGIDIASDGTQVIRTDTYGGYIWENGAWRQLFTRASMPATVDLMSGVYELRVAPSSSNVLYAEVGNGIYRSADKGHIWQRTAFPISTSEPNGDHRMDGQKMAVHPSNPQIVLAGTQGKGAYLTRDGGATWSKVETVPPGPGTKDPGLTGIVLNASRAFIATAGSGVYESADGAGTWRSIGGPASVNHAVMAKDGAYLASEQGSGALWRWADGQWTKVLPEGTGAHALAVDATRNGRVALTNDGGSVRISDDNGKTWTEQSQATQLISADIPWLKDTGLYLSSGGIAFDPKVTGRLVQSAGVGVWDTTVPEVVSWQKPIIWSSRSAGIEQLVTNDIAAPAGGDPVLANWDRALFRVNDPEGYPANYSPPGFNMAWSVTYASTDPRFLVGLVNYWGKPEESGFSTDGGKTWQKFASVPTSAVGSAGGSIAASTPQNFVWVPGQNRRPAYTLDGGKTWQDVTLPGVTDYRMLHVSYYLNRHIVSADRVTPNVFYLYDASETLPAVYQSRDGGKTWSKVFAGQPSQWSYWNAKMEAVPGQAGHLYFSSGPQGSSGVPDAITLSKSEDGGKSWKSLPGVKVIQFGFGAPVTAGGPAAIYMWGMVNDVRAIWGSGDDGQTWIKLGTYPLGSLDNIKVVSGDMARPGRVYIGFGGSGWAYLDR